jgi:hypothetical protein
MTNTTQTLRLLVEETSEELSSVEAELAAAREQVTRLEEKAVVLRAEHASFVSALERRVPAARVETAPSVAAEQIETPAPEPMNEWQRMSRTDAVEKALAEIEPAGPADIHTYLTDKGRDDGRDLVSAALAHLKRSGRAWRGGYSLWSTKPFPTNTSGPDDESGPEGGVSVTTTGTGGDTRAEPDQDHGDLLGGRNREDRGGDPSVGTSV